MSKVKFSRFLLWHHKTTAIASERLKREKSEKKICLEGEDKNAAPTTTRKKALSGVVYFSKQKATALDSAIRRYAIFDPRKRLGNSKSLYII